MRRIVRLLLAGPPEVALCARGGRALWERPLEGTDHLEAP